MFYVKGDDMEEMFKKAADDYELNEELASDWNSIQTALQNNAESVIAAPAQEKKRRRYLLFWWLLLIPAAFLIAYTSGLFKASSIKTANTKINKTVLPIEQSNSSNNQNNIASNQVSSVQIKKPSRQETSNNLKYDNAVIAHENHLSILENNKNKKLNESLITENDSAVPNNISEKAANDQNNVQSSSQNNKQSKNQNKNQVKSANENNALVNKANENSIKGNSNIITDSLSKTNTAVSKTNALKKTTRDSKIKQAYFYAGLAGNIDLSVIKYQKISAPGFGGGITAGYHFKNRISVETGLLYDRKNYYTNGKYFNTKNFSYFTSTNSKVINADGNCNMWELPLTVNYDFATHKKYNLFVSAGVSSYFMHKEYYDFTYEKNGYVDQGGYAYFHTKPDFFSVMNLGAGVNMHLSNKYSFKIQPYYKIPLSKVGMANLSLTSGGINIFINRRIN